MVLWRPRRLSKSSGDVIAWRFSDVKTGMGFSRIFVVRGV